MLVIIGGPTASKKSELALKVAERLNGEIISADSMQVYKKMDIGTAKITAEAMGGIPHYGIDIVEPDHSFSVAEYNIYAEAVIKDILGRGKTPIVVGGTGLYIRSLLYPFGYGGTSEHSDLRKSLVSEAEVYGKMHVYEKLRDMDPERAASIHPNNLKRVIRAIEIATYGSKETVTPKRRSDALYFVTSVERPIIVEWINSRVDKMISAGLEEEVRGLLKSGITFENHSMQGIGYKEWRGFFEGRESLNDVIDKIKRNTRAYAKRQVTWFKREAGIQLNSLRNVDDLAAFIEDSYKKHANQ